MSSASALWEEVLTQLPLIAILRGIQPEEALSVAEALHSCGYKCLEIPLNSPHAFKTIEIIAREFGTRMLVGAGTVLNAQAATDTLSAGGQIVVSPNLDEEVAQACRHHECIYCPGVATPSEAFYALKLGASALKLFPAELITPTVVKAMRAVLPSDAIVLPVGGISPGNMHDYLSVGSNGFGLGSGLYKPGKSIEDIKKDANGYVAAMQKT
ncbi:MAG: 2-dehydro-3-deoxy-6-phosphogalactonate aldolase [Granulosicoccus sp.]